MKRAPFLGLFLAGLILGPGHAGASGNPSSPKVTGVVNLNTATPEQLKILPGVKDKAAAEIVAHRAKHPFTRPEELVKVKGFSKKRYERVKPFITVHGDSTIRAAEKVVRKALHKAEKKTKKH